MVRPVTDDLIPCRLQSIDNAENNCRGVDQLPFTEIYSNSPEIDRPREWSHGRDANTLSLYHLDSIDSQRWSQNVLVRVGRVVQLSRLLAFKHAYYSGSQAKICR